MFDKLKGLLAPSPEQIARNELIKKVAAASAYHKAISEHVGPDRKTTYREEIRHDLVNTLGLQWLTDHARGVFPKIDEFEVEKDWVINHPDHDQREEHQRFTLRQLGAWIDTQKRGL